MASPEAKIEILIVEDSPTQAEQLKHLIIASGYEVLVATNGKEALELARRRKPTIIVSDIVMPGMDGYALCKEIKSDETLRDTPVILVTALSGPEDVFKGLECGADNFIRKPYEGKYLLARIEYILTNRELGAREKLRMGVEISLGGRSYFITAQRQQILDLLISTYDEAVHLNDKLNRSLLTLNGLYHVAAGLNQATTQSEVYRTSLERALELPGVQAGWVSARDESSALHVVASRGLPPELEAPGRLERDCPCHRALLAGDAEGFASFPDCDLLARGAGGSQPFHLHASVPLRANDQVVGILDLIGPEDGAFSDDDEKILVSIGNQVGIALERALLREHLEKIVEERTFLLTAEIAERKRAEQEIQNQLQRLGSLRSIDVAITSSLDLHVTLNILLEQVTSRLGADAADLLLLNPHLQTLECSADHGFRTEAIRLTRVRLGECIAGRAALERRIVSAPDLPREPAFSRARLLAGEEFVAYFAVPLIAKGQVKGVLEIFNRAPLNVGREWIEFLEALAGQAAIAIDSSQLFENLEHSNVELVLAYEATIEGWSRALDLRDKETEGHTQRVTEATVRLARAMGFTDAELVHVRRGALLHDIGKMGIPDRILLKPDKLTPEEWEVMRKHPDYAFEMLSPIAYLRPALDIPYCHHEKWDGSGYPRGLKGEQIPLSARLFALVDVWDALRSDRPYRPAWPEERVAEQIRAGVGTHFDPQAAEAFLKLIGQITHG